MFEKSPGEKDKKEATSLDHNDNSGEEDKKKNLNSGEEGSVIIRPVGVFRPRDPETQAEMERIRREIEKDREDGREGRSERNEVRALQEEYVLEKRRGSSLSKEKQDRLNELEDKLYKQQQEREAKIKERLLEKEKREAEKKEDDKEKETKEPIGGAEDERMSYEGAEEKGKEGPSKGKLEEIERNLSDQPRSLRDNIHELKDALCKEVEIDGKNFIFSKINGDEVLALVEDEGKPGKWKPRYFRFSGSDLQWKSHPGSESDGRLMKGEERHHLNHYVQSNKLHKDVYKVINDLPQGSSSLVFHDLLPVPGGGENYAEELEIKEKHKEFNDPEWKRFQKKCQGYYKYYHYLVCSGNSDKDYFQGSHFYKMLEKNPNKELQNIKDQIDKIQKNERAASLLKSINIKKMEGMESYSELQKLALIYRENVGKIVEKMFRVQFPESMTPNFSQSDIVDSYIKKDIDPKRGNDINIEEYKVKSPEGDEVVFSMAYDSKGRVYIDNIYDPRVGVGSYGTLEEIVQMGHLVYKPQDHSKQTYVLPEKYKREVKDNGKYTDISSLLENISIVKKFKEKLIREGKLKDENADRVRQEEDRSSEKEKVFDVQIENNTHPKAKSLQGDVILFIESLDREERANHPDKKEVTEFLRAELEEILYRNGLEYRSGEETQITEEDRIVLEPIYNMRKEMEGKEELSADLIRGYRKRVTDYLESVFGMDEIVADKGKRFNSKEHRCVKIEETDDPTMDSLIKEEIKPGFKMNEDLYEYHKNKFLREEKSKKKELDDIKGKVSKEEFDKKHGDLQKWREDYTFSKVFKPSRVTVYRYQAKD